MSNYSISALNKREHFSFVTFDVAIKIRGDLVSSAVFSVCSISEAHRYNALYTKLRKVKVILWFPFYIHIHRQISKLELSTYLIFFFFVISILQNSRLRFRMVLLLFQNKTNIIKAYHETRAARDTFIRWHKAEYDSVSGVIEAICLPGTGLERRHPKTKKRAAPTLG